MVFGKIEGHFLLSCSGPDDLERLRQIRNIVDVAAALAPAACDVLIGR